MPESSLGPLWRQRLRPVAVRVLGPSVRRLRRGRIAVRAATDAARNPDVLEVAPVAVVEQFDRRVISGWVAARPVDLPSRVTLHVSGLEIAATWAGQPSTLNTHTDIRAFRFALRDVWDYCGKRDTITVRLDGAPVPIAGTGTFVRPERNGRHNRAELKAKFASGHVFSQKGRLQLSKKLDTAWQAVVFDLYDRVSAVLSREFGYDAFLVYGSLLGQVREGGFIGHDVDFDTAYLSGLTDPKLVARELRDIALCLVDAGFEVTCMRSAAHVHDAAAPDVRIDLFHVYFDDKDELQFPFGTVSSARFPRSRWTGVVDAEFSGHRVKVPAAGPDLAAHLYGPAWQVPVPGFNWREERGGWAPEGWIPTEYREEVYWANFYARHELADGSTFFDFVSAREDIPSTVLDIGCGDGRDSFAFARRGSRVHGIDRSKVGVRVAARNASAAGLDRLSFAAVDAGDAPAVRESVSSLRSAAGGGPILFYLRFFLHSIPEDVQATLLDALADASREGDMMAIEFRTDADAEAPKVHGGHYRRYQNGAEFGAALRDRFGFADVRFEQESAGLAPYKDEDPVVYRVVAARTGATRG